MTKQNFIIFAILFAFSFIKTDAGWYECYNFSGTIDKSPVTLSIQIREGYFGEKEKKNFNVIGIYKSSENAIPVRLEGRRNPADDKVVLYEVKSGKRAAAFEFNFSVNESKGFWTNLLNAQKLPLSLKYVSKLADTTQEDRFANVEILQANSLKDFYFVGVYSKAEDQQDAAMTQLKIIRKKDDSLFQTLDFSEIETPTGNVMTVIYDNVEADDKSRNFTVSNKAGRTGGYLRVKFDVKKQKFVLNRKPFLEGPN